MTKSVCTNAPLHREPSPPLSAGYLPLEKDRFLTSQIPPEQALLVVLAVAAAIIVVAVRRRRSGRGWQREELGGGPTGGGFQPGITTPSECRWLLISGN